MVRGSGPPSIVLGAVTSAQDVIIPSRGISREVTFTGGDPMYQCDGFAELARAIHRQTNKDIWCYTGFPFESLITRAQRELLELLDVLVDGPYIEKLRDPDLLFRGSSNQRLIDVQKSLYSGQTVLWSPDVSVSI